MDLELDMFINQNLNWILDPNPFMNQNLKQVSDQVFMSWKVNQILHPYEIISAPAVRNSIYAPNTCFHGVPNKNCYDELELGLIIKIYLTPAQVI